MIFQASAGGRREIEPSTPLSWNWHHELMREHLNVGLPAGRAAADFLLPPRGLKSKLVSVFFPAWVWAKSLGRVFILTRTPIPFPKSCHMGRRNLLQSEWYQTTFPNKVQFAADQNRREKFKTTAAGNGCDISGRLLTGPVRIIFWWTIF